jgi:hypothetical protein
MHANQLAAVCVEVAFCLSRLAVLALVQLTASRLGFYKLTACVFVAMSLGAIFVFIAVEHGFEVITIIFVYMACVLVTILAVGLAVIYHIKAFIFIMLMGLDAFALFESAIILGFPVALFSSMLMISKHASGVMLMLPSKGRIAFFNMRQMLAVSALRRPYAACYGQNHAQGQQGRE